MDGEERREEEGEKEGGRPPVCPLDLINGRLRLSDGPAGLLPFYS